MNAIGMDGLMQIFLLVALRLACHHSRFMFLDRQTHNPIEYCTRCTYFQRSQNRRDHLNCRSQDMYVVYNNNACSKNFIINEVICKRLQQFYIGDLVAVIHFVLTIWCKDFSGMLN